MQVASAIAILLATAALLWCALVLQRHGIAGVLYLTGARLFALADGMVIGQVQYRLSLMAKREMPCLDCALKIEVLEKYREGRRAPAVNPVTSAGGGL